MISQLLTSAFAIGVTTLVFATAPGASAATTKPAKQPIAAASPTPQATVMAAPATTASEPKTYVVASGDSLSTIAAGQGLDSWRPLWDANASLSDPNIIFPGQSLTVPSTPVAARPLPVGVDQSAPQAQVEAVQPAAVASQPAPKAAVVTGSGATSDIFGRIRQRESGGNYAVNTGNGYYGAYQFNLGTWRSNAPAGYENIRPDQAPPAVQDQAAQTLYARRGCSPWPNTCY